MHSYLLQCRGRDRYDGLPNTFLPQEKEQCQPEGGWLGQSEPGMASELLPDWSQAGVKGREDGELFTYPLLLSISAPGIQSAKQQVQVPLPLVAEAQCGTDHSGTSL